MNPAHAELAQLAKIQARADQTHADATRWLSLQEQAERNLSSAQVTFVATLDAKAAAAVAEAANHVRALAPACAAIMQAGGPDGLRYGALHAPEVYAAMAAGFEKRYDAIEKLKPAARAIFANRAAVAATEVSDPRDVLALHQLPPVRDAHALLDAVGDSAQAALVAHNYSTAPDKYTPRPVDELLALLASPLPVVPVVPAA